MPEPVLKIAVSAHRDFALPADLATTEAHFREFRQTLQDLPELHLVETYSRNRYRILYSATVAGVYRVNLYSDIRARFDGRGHVLLVTPLREFPAVAARVTLGSLTGQGEYTSRLALQARGAQTDAAYDLGISARIPKPIALRLLPDSIASMVVEGVVRQRIQEITDRFIQRSIVRLNR